ncbi:MAG: S8 family serine peptidase [Pyrinomonadaceae bacterium]
MGTLGRLMGFGVILMAASFALMAAPSIDGLLASKVNALPLGLTPVVITFDHKPINSDFLMLQSIGIRGGRVLNQLPIVLTSINKVQLNSLKTKAGIRSLYANRTFKLLDFEGRTITGIEKMIRDTEVTTRNQGLPVSGRNIGIAYVDTGIDATHPDLQLGQNVIQNVYFATADVMVELPAGFLPIVPVENAPISDVEGGHGTFGAGVAAGTGAASGGLYTGMAPGAKLIGIRAGNDVGLTTYAIVQAMDYSLVNQFRYNIRVCNNSWGTTLADLPYDANDPINTATRTMHDRNITVVFAAGNDGDAPDMINPYSVAPWVISVAAAEKQGYGTPAGFSSRGNDNGTGSDTAGQPADPSVAPNFRPDITGSGVDIKSTRSKAPGVTNVAGSLPVFVGANDLSTIPPAFLPFYTTSQGTSFSTPQVSGIVALMMEANPLLTPDEVVTILRQTANPMPYEQRVVGAGYVDAHNAVRTAMSLAAVDHPTNLFPPDDPNAPQIVDAANDQTGTTAQDIREAYFKYDAAANQIVYRLSVTDASVTTPNMRWTMTSTFGATQVFVTASVDETTTTFEYGKITTLATGTQNQETIGAVDFGEINGNVITIRLSLDKINAAVGSNVLNTTSTNTSAEAQILIGSSITGGLLLNADRANGSDFNVRGTGTSPTPTPTPEPTPEPTPVVTPTPTPAPAPTGRFDERYSGTLNVGQSSVSIPLEIRRSTLVAQINQNQGNQQIVFELLDPAGNVIATGKNINLDGLSQGAYTYRIHGSVSKAVDFTIKSSQGK